MSSAVVAVSIALMVLVVVSLWWVMRERRNNASHLASALIGEITATLESIETQQLVDLLKRDALDPKTAGALQAFALPRFMAFEANAAKLDCLPANVERMAVNLFDRWSVFCAEVKGSAVVAGDRKPVLHEATELLQLADDLLLALRQIATPASKAHHLDSRQIGVARGAS
jgi:hypothetical protein